MSQATESLYECIRPDLHRSEQQSGGLHSSSSPVVQARPIHRTVEKSVRLNLIGLDGNAIVLGGAFISSARCQGWREEEIRAVIRDATSHNYQRLLHVLALHCEW